MTEAFPYPDGVATGVPTEVIRVTYYHLTAKDGRRLGEVAFLGVALAR